MPIDPSPYLPAAAPDVPDRTNRTGFATQMYNFFVWMAKATAGGLYYALQYLPSNVYSNALEVYAAATVKAIANFKGIYVGGTTYVIGDTVYVSGSGFYISNVNANVGNSPASSPTQWSPISLGNRSGGATVASTWQTVLVAGSAQVQRFAPGAAGQSVKLPDATTCQLVTTPYFVIVNKGSFDLKILDFGGTLRGFVAPATSVTVALYDNSTAAGGWGLTDARLFGVTSHVSGTGGVTLTTASVISVVPLDATKTVIVFGSTGSNNVYAVCYDDSTGTFGAIVLVDTPSGQNGFLAQKVSATSFVVFTASTTSTTRLRCTGCTISGTTITVGTTVTTTTANGTQTLFSTALVSSSACLAYNDSTATKVVAVTLSGTVPTFGTPATVNASGTSGTKLDLYGSGSILVAIGGNGTANTMAGTPYTVSGTTLTLGTAASVGTSTITSFRTIAVSATGWLCIDQDSGLADTKATYFTLSGTTVTQSTTSVALGGAAGIAFSPLTEIDAALIGGRVIIAMANGSSFGGVTLVSFSGTTLSASGASAGSFMTGWGQPALFTLPSGALFARMVVQGSSSLRVITIDCSGATPVVGVPMIMGGPDNISLPAISTTRGKRHPMNMANANFSCAVPAWVSGSPNKRGSALAVMSQWANREWVVQQDLGLSGSVGDVGNSTTESWFMADVAVAQANSNSLYLQRVEMATP